MLFRVVEQTNENLPENASTELPLVSELLHLGNLHRAEKNTRSSGKTKSKIQT